MHWVDEGIVIAVRPHGETAAVAELFTRDHGRHSGLVYGGRSRKLRPVLQIGNHVAATWTGRLSEHLGHFQLELRHAYAATAMDDGAALTGLGALCALAHLLPERDPHAAFYGITLLVVSHLDHPTIWPILFVRWEMALLDELGLGLDLSACASTGQHNDLAYVSPKSGRAVSAEAGAPYAHVLLPLPAFLIGPPETLVTANDVHQGLALTGYFLEHRILRPREMAMPEARARLPEVLAGCENLFRVS